MILQIRFASIADAELIADLSRQTFYETYVDLNTKEDMDKFMNERFTKPALMKEVSENGSIFLLAYNENEPAGYLRLRENNNLKQTDDLNVLEIVRIYVVKKFIGKGVGKALMEKSIAIAKEKNIQTICLAVWPKNLKAVDFYSKWGFEKFGEQDFIFGNDVQKDWLMKKVI